MQQQETVALGNLGEISVGYQLRKSVEPEPDGEHTLIQLRNVQDGALDLVDLTRMTLDAKTPKRFVRPGDILLRSRGATYGAAPVYEVPENTVALAPLFLMRLNPSVPVEQEYLVWFINRAETQASLRTTVTGSYIPSVSLAGFKALSVVVPNIEVQRRIVEVNDLARRERELTRQRQAVRETQIAALLEEYLKQQ